MNDDPQNPSDAKLAVMRWYVVATRPGMELIARDNLERQGFKAWLPELILKKRLKGKWTKVVEPMFAGYVFTQLVFGEDNPAPIRSTYGCRGLVRFGNAYPTMPEELMGALFTACEEAAYNVNCNESIFAKGEWVLLANGPFKGLRAIFHMPSGRDRARVLIDLLGSERSVLVRMNDLASAD